MITIYQWIKTVVFLVIVVAVVPALWQVTAQATELVIQGLRGSSVTFYEPDGSTIETVPASEAAWLLGAKVTQDPATQLFVVKGGEGDMYVSSFDFQTGPGSADTLASICARMPSGSATYARASGYAAFCSGR